MRGARALLGTFFALSFCACGSTPDPWTLPGDAGEPYLLLEPAAVDDLREGIEQLERNKLSAARATFAALLAGRPGDLAAAVWLQEAQITIAERRATRMGLDSLGRDEPRSHLRDLYRRAAENQPTSLAWFLAARIEDDGPAATLLLQRALELDPAMTWAHYGLAHVAARSGNWGLAREELDQAFSLDSGHLPSLRLYAWLQAEGGDLERAALAYESWLLHADEDLLATQSTRERVTLDLALVHLADGDEERAAERLATLVPGRVDEVRRLSCLAAIEEARDRIDAALRAASAARDAGPGALLPIVQEALLLEYWRGDLVAARDAWREVLRLSDESLDLAAGLQRFRAELHLERLERTLAETQP